jgi:hypothetical protein
VRVNCNQTLLYTSDIWHSGSTTSGTCRRAHCDALLGPETAALHSVAAPRCERRPSSSLGQRPSGGDDGGGLETFSRGSGGSATSADEEAAGFWAAVYRAGVAMDAAYFLEGASERFAASVPEVHVHDSAGQGAGSHVSVGMSLIMWNKWSGNLQGA